MSKKGKYGYWVNAGKFTALTKFTTLATGIVSFMLLARMLGPSVFGVWGLFITISAITETARVSLIRNAFIRFSHQHKEADGAGLQAATLGINILLSLVLALLFLLLAHPLSFLLNAPMLSTALVWFAGTLPVTALLAHCEMNLTAKLRFKEVSFIYCLRQLSFALAIAVCFAGKLPLTLTMLCVFYLVAATLAALLGIGLTASHLSFNIKQGAGWVGQLWQFGKFVFGTNISSLLFRSTDNFMAAAFFSTTVSAYYNASLRISNLVDMPSQILSDVVFPKAVQFGKDDKEGIRRMYEKAVGASMVFSIPALLVLMLFPEPILRLLAGDNFIASAPILRITAFFGLMLPFLKQFGTIMDATGHPHLNFRTMLLALVLNVGTNLLGIWLFGSIGAAIGTAVTYSIICIVALRMLHQKFGVRFSAIIGNTIHFYKELLIIARRWPKRRPVMVKI